MNNPFSKLKSIENGSYSFAFGLNRLWFTIIYKWIFFILLIVRGPAIRTLWCSDHTPTFTYLIYRFDPIKKQRRHPVHITHDDPLTRASIYYRIAQYVHYDVCVNVLIWQYTNRFGSSRFSFRVQPHRTRITMMYSQYTITVLLCGRFCIIRNPRYEKIRMKKKKTGGKQFK